MENFPENKDYEMSDEEMERDARERDIKFFCDECYGDPNIYEEITGRECPYDPGICSKVKYRDWNSKHPL